MHRYYDFMPDLNITQPDVRDEMNKILGFWLELGVSGLPGRLAAVHDRDDRHPARDNPVTYLQSLVEFMERRRGDAIFLGEANVCPEEQERYLAMDGGEGVQMLFDFRTCAAQWLAHARGDAQPLIDALGQPPGIPQHAQFANFCRHHDELNLGMLSDGEREEVFAAFAPEQEHREYGRGIRRRLAPDARQRPAPDPARAGADHGAAGHAGHDVRRRARHGRGPVPARAARRPQPDAVVDRAAGGFSAADQSCTGRPGADGPFGYRAVNVAAQRHQPDSLRTWVTNTIRVRRECPELGWGQWRTLPVGDPRVLAIEYRWRDGWVVTLHNLSAEPATAQLPDDLSISPSSRDVVEVLGDGESPTAIGPEIELAGYGYRWLRLSDDSSPV